MRQKKYRIFLSIFLSVLILPFVHLSCAHVSPRLNPYERTSQNEHLPYGYPGIEGQILYRTGYVLAHNKETKVADWVSYHLTSEYLEGIEERTDDFRPDLDLKPGERSELVDYRGSGYDRGHLAPAGDMKRSQRTMSESFLLSNIAPQVGPGFNRGIWQHLESRVREWAREKQSIHVMTGPLYLGEDGSALKNLSELKTIGPSKVAVPTHFYKIIVTVEPEGEMEAVSFILPNENTSSNRPPEFVSSVDEIERLTGLDFLNALGDGLEAELESRKASAF